jgi:tetratricopeptide (TPR) repeat protein
MNYSRSGRQRWLMLIVIGGLVCVAGLSHWLDSHPQPTEANIAEEQLYLNGATARRISLSFNGLAADWYWMRALQYVGSKVINVPASVPIDSLSQLNLKLLAPLLDTATTLDPQFMEPYEYAAVVLPDVDLQQAIRITKKGIRANPSAWRLHQHLGFIYWQQQDFQAAGEAYAEGAKLPGAPLWMEAMKARMAVEGGSRHLAREIYGRMYEQTEDTRVKEMARLRLMHLDSLNDRDALLKALSAFRAKTGRCPSTWKETEPLLRALNVNTDSTGSPIDPGGTSYVLIIAKCDLNLDRSSKVPRK